MLISDATARAFDNISARQRDVLHAFTPGAVPERSDVSATPETRFTLDPLSVAAPPNAYFAVAGDRETIFTRDGRFQIRNGTLTDETGRAVLGYRASGESLSSLHVDAIDAALGVIINPRVEADGTLAYDRDAIEPKTGTRQAQKVIVGRIALARFPAASRIESLDGNHIRPQTGVRAHFGVPDSTDFRALTPFSQEHSGIDIDATLERLDDAYLALDALQAANKVQGSTQKTAMDLLK